MIIDSVSFIFRLLPFFLIFFALFKENYRKPLILCTSLLICSWGSFKSLLLLLVFILASWLFGQLIPKNKNYFYASLGFDVIFLCFFKFIGLNGALPLGISYYVLSGMSYLIDLCRGDVDPNQSLYNTAFYLAFFPKLIMGPFVKYKDFETQIDNPIVDAKKVSDGLLRFSIGLAKKLAIAGSLAEMTAKCWEDAPFSGASAWLGVISFALQLYYDFSGYSDMAIGLAKVCGFKIRENFNYPMESASLKEFWSKWHISLGEWFKDYIYFPLGGNRRGELRTYINLLLVWLVTGFWHGNGLNYILWGLFIFIFASLEKKFTNFLGKVPNGIRIVFTNLIVLIGWAFFNSGSIPAAFNYIGYMFGGAAAAGDAISSLYFTRFIDLLVLAILGVTHLPKQCALDIFDEEKPWTVVFKCIFIIGLLGVSTASIIINGYTPFIYAGF